MSEFTNSLKSIEFTWKIANYSQQKFTTGPGKWISSQTFSVDCESSLEFTLEFYPQGDVQSGDIGVTNGEKWASLGLATESNKKYIKSHLIEFSILNADGEKFGIRHFHQKLPIDCHFPKFIRLSRLENPANNLLPNDTLTICCRVEETKWETEECKCLLEKPETAQARLAKDLATLLDDKFADFVFKVENVKIPTHRAILAARSPVFAAMFQHDTQQNRTIEVEIKDVTPAAFRALLRFIYTGHCQVGLWAEDLFMAAIKYEIKDLIQIGAKEMEKKLTADNAVRLLILSDLHQANDLKGAAMDFINKNAPAVMKKPSWPAFVKSHQNLVTELYCKLFESK
jgi:speckle-type POZ protein